MPPPPSYTTLQCSVVYRDHVPQALVRSSDPCGVLGQTGLYIGEAVEEEEGEGFMGLTN